MTTPKEIHIKLLTDISDDMDTDSDEYKNFIEHMKAYVPRGVLARKGKLLDKLDVMTTRGYLGIGRYELLEKVAELSGNNTVKDMIEETKQKLQALDVTTRSYTGLGAPTKRPIAAASDVSPTMLSESQQVVPIRKQPRQANLDKSDDSGLFDITEEGKHGTVYGLQFSVLPIVDEAIMIVEDTMPQPYFPHQPQTHVIPEFLGHALSDYKQKMDTLLESLELVDECPSHLELNKVKREFGRNSPKVKQMCDTICCKIKESSRDIKLVWAGYKVSDEDPSENITFVAVTENGDLGYRTILGFNVLFCKENTCNDEGQIVMNSQQTKEKPFTRKELKQLEQCLSKYSRELMSSHSNIEIMTACSVKSTHFKETDGVPDFLNETCIVLYVHVKGIVPLQEEVFPKQIWGFPVDVREGCFMLCGGPNEYHDTLKMGCEIGRYPQCQNGSSGTLGAFIEHSGDNYCLTSAHVLLTDTEFLEVEHSGGRKICDSVRVHQPVRNPPQAEDHFGSLVEVIYETGGENNTGMEIAVVKIQHRSPVSGEFPDGEFEHAGFNASQPMVFNSGEILHSSAFINSQDTMDSEVVKYGCTSKVTRGSFALVGTAVRTRDYSFPVGRFNVELHGQIEISKIGETKFAELGDSGALVFGFLDNNKSYLRPVGILTGLTTYGGAIITTISAILEKLGVNKLKCFPGSYPESMSGINSVSVNQHLDGKLDTMKTEINENIDSKMKAQQQETNAKLETMQNEIKSTKSTLEKMQNEMKSNKKSMEDMLKQILSNTKK